MATLPTPDTVSFPSAKRTLMVAREDGRLYRLDFSENPQLGDPGLIDWDLSVSKVLIGKFQLVRTRAVTLDEIEIENIVRTNQLPSGTVHDLEVTVFNSLDGKNAQAAVFPVAAHESGGLIHLKTRLTGQNFSMQLRGTYNINTVVFTTHQNGRR